MTVISGHDEGEAALWDEEHVKALLHFPRYPVRLIQEEPWQGWIRQRGGLRAVYEYLQNYSFSPSHQHILEVVLSKPENVSNVYADQLNISRATYFYRLRELLPAVVNALNSWQLSEDAAAPIQRTAIIVQPSVPVPLTGLFGAESTLETLTTLILRDDVRLLTLLGAGGIGKTRLSIELANRVRDLFSGGVCFFDLSPMHLSQAIIPTIARSLGLETTDESELIAYYAERKALLILDNFEHLLPGAPLLGGLLAGAPELKILATSRAALHIYGEYEFTIPPLPTPPQSAINDLEEAAQSPAVALFVQRAQAVNPSLMLTHANVEAIVELCSRMDGIPLAIELAAYQAKYYSPQAMLVRLSNSKSLNFLNTGPKRLHAHQQTPRDILDWSYELLSPELKLLFNRLAVFIGGCTLDAAAWVCADPLVDIDTVGDAQIDNLETAQSVLSGLAALADQSLLQLVTEPDGEPRYQMLRVAREYGLEQLDLRGETLDRERAAASYYLRLAEQAAHQKAASWRAWAQPLQLEYTNLKAAITWFLEHDEGDKALRLVVALWNYWKGSGSHQEGYQIVQDVLNRTEHVLQPIRARVLRLAGWLAHDLCDYRIMYWAFQSTFGLADVLNDPREKALAAQGVAETLRFRGHWQGAEEHITQALSILQTLSDEQQTAWSTAVIGRIAFSQGNHQEALARFDESLATFNALDAKSAQATVMAYMGQTMFAVGVDDKEAERLLKASLRLSKRIEDIYSPSIALAQIYLAQIAIDQQQFAEAREGINACFALSKQIGYAGCVELAHYTSALLAAAQDKPSRAVHHYRESLLLQETIKETWRTIELLDAVAMFLVTMNESLSSARLFGAIEHLRETMNVQRCTRHQPAYERSIDHLRKQLDAATLDGAWMAGQALTLDQALAYALRCLE